MIASQYMFSQYGPEGNTEKSLALLTITVWNIQPCMQSCDNLGFICFVCVDVSYRRRSWIKQIEHFNSCICVEGGITALGGSVIAHLEGQVNKTKLFSARRLRCSKSPSPNKDIQHIAVNHSSWWGIMWKKKCVLFARTNEEKEAG